MIVFNLIVCGDSIVILKEKLIIYHFRMLKIVETYEYKGVY